MIKEDGSLHFFVNSTDLGCAAQGVPPNVYGVVDLFGQCSQVTIISEAEEVEEVNVTNALNGKDNRMFFFTVLFWIVEQVIKSCDQQLIEQAKVICAEGRLGKRWPLPQFLLG